MQPRHCKEEYLHWVDLKKEEGGESIWDWDGRGKKIKDSNERKKEEEVKYDKVYCFIGS